MRNEVLTPTLVSFSVKYTLFTLLDRAFLLSVLRDKILAIKIPNILSLVGRTLGGVGIPLNGVCIYFYILAQNTDFFRVCSVSNTKEGT